MCISSFILSQVRKYGPRHEKLFNTIKKRKQEHTIFVLESFGALSKMYFLLHLYTQTTLTLNPWSSDSKVILKSAPGCSGNQFGISCCPQACSRNELWYICSMSNCARKLNAIGDCSKNLTLSGINSSTANLTVMANHVMLRGFSTFNVCVPNNFKYCIINLCVLVRDCNLFS